MAITAKNAQELAKLIRTSAIVGFRKIPLDQLQVIHHAQFTAAMMIAEKIEDGAYFGEEPKDELPSI